MATRSKSKATHHCLEIFACPHEALSLPEADRRKVTLPPKCSAPIRIFKKTYAYMLAGCRQYHQIIATWRL